MSGYLLTETAEEDLEEILGYIAESDGKARAIHVLQNLVDAFERLTASPGMGYRRVQLTGPKLRWWPVSGFLVIYDPQADPLVVMRIVHGARDLDRLFGSGD